MLKNELQIMRQQLQRLDPNGPHVYGHFTSQLNQGPQSQPQTKGTGGSGISLPPLNPGSSGGHGVGHAGGSYGNSVPGAMQGVEYGYGR